MCNLPKPKIVKQTRSITNFELSLLFQTIYIDIVRPFLSVYNDLNLYLNLNCLLMRIDRSVCWAEDQPLTETFGNI